MNAGRLFNSFSISPYCSTIIQGKWRKCIRRSILATRKDLINRSHCSKQTKISFGGGARNISVAELAYELEEYKKSEKETADVAKVLVLYTGGTIGMKNINGAYCPSPGYLHFTLADQSTLNDYCFISNRFPSLSARPFALSPICGLTRRLVYWLVEYEPLLDSCDMTIDDWIRIAKDIRSAYELYDGFVVLHGTDTLAYTASALSFLLENLQKPVIVTGSQIPVAEVRSDGLYNFAGALIAAGNLDIPEVCVYFNNKLMRGNRTVKVDNTDLNAFDSPNLPPLANMGIRISVDYGTIAFTTAKAPNSAISSLGYDTLLQSITIRACIPPQLKGVILQTFGVGNVSSRRPDIIQVIKDAIDRGCLVINCSQCLRGEVMATYSTGRILSEVGVVSGRDLTTEAAMTKLSYVLAKVDCDLKMQRKLMETNLRGEMCHL